MKLSNAQYDAMKWVAQIALPAIGAAYFTLAQLWGLPAAEEIVGTITVVDVLLGALLGLSSSQYNGSERATDGYISVEPDQELDVTHLNFSMNPDLLYEKDRIVLNIKRPEQ